MDRRGFLRGMLAAGGAVVAAPLAKLVPPAAREESFYKQVMRTRGYPIQVLALGPERLESEVIDGPLQFTEEDSTMKHNPVKSSNIESYGYDAGTRTLEVRFKPQKNTPPNTPGKLYTFSDVPPETAKGLAGADSPGSYFAANIRGRFGGVPS